MEGKTRGRPKGSKNKPKDNAPGERDVQQPSNLQIPKPKGRSAKAPSQTDPAQRHYLKTTYVYTELAKTAISSTDLYNLYGIIVDATSPHKKEPLGYKTHIRVIDPSMFDVSNYTHSEGAYQQSIMITLYSKSLGQLPVFKQVGDIIRIHRASIGQYKNQKTFYVNIVYGSSWVIFEGIPCKRLKQIEPQHNSEKEERVEMPSGDILSESAEDNQVEKENKPQKDAKNVKSEEAISRFFGFQDQHQISTLTNKEPKLVLDPSNQSNESSLCSNMGDKPIPVTQTYTPIKSSTNGYSLGLVDRDIVKRYRQWLVHHFTSEFQYEPNAISQLAKVREATSNAMILDKTPAHQSDYETIMKLREFDLLVRINGIKEIEVQPAIEGQLGIEESKAALYGSPTKEEQKGSLKMVIFKISDSSCTDFELTVPQSIAPEGVRVGDVIKVSKAAPCKSNLRKMALEALEHTNILKIDQTFKLSQQLQAGYYMEQVEYDITKILLGEAYNQPSTQPSYLNDFAHLNNQTEDVIEKPESASIIGEMFRHFPKVELAEVLHGQHYLQNLPQTSPGTFPHQKLFRVNFYVLNIQPLNLFEFTQLYCQRCFQAYSFREFSNNANQSLRCHVCSSDLEAIYKVHFVVKDKSLFNVQGGVKMVLFTSEGICDKFFNGIPAQNMYRDPVFRTHIERYVRHVVRFNVYIDAIVEKKMINEEVVLKLVSCRLKVQ